MSVVKWIHNDYMQMKIYLTNNENFVILPCLLCYLPFALLKLQDIETYKTSGDRDPQNFRP